MSEGTPQKLTDNRAFRRILGLVSTFPIPLIGYAFSWASVLALLLIPMRTVRGWPLRVKVILWLALLSMAMLAISALIFKADIATFNVYSTAAFCLMMIAAVKLTDGVQAASHFLAWSSIGTVLFYIFIGAENSRDTFEHLWKYGIAVPITFLVIFLALARTQHRAIPIILLVAIGSMSIFLGFRSHGLVCMAVVLLLFVKGKSRSSGRGLFKAFLAAAAFVALATIMPIAINSGLFGEAVKARTEEQISSGASLLLAGRVEPPLSVAAVLARPFLGWGDLNNIDQATMAQGRDFARALGMDDPAAYMGLWIRSDGRVSVHSVFFEAWVQGGILAALFPIALLALFVAGITRTSGKWSPMVVLVSVQGIWDVLFSTWGIGRPATLALSAIVVAWAVTDAHQKQQESAAEEIMRNGAAVSRRSSRLRTPSRPSSLAASRRDATQTSDL
ncbi:hypothetical protein [Plantibacter sp. YIM 135249]|uniref:hypothetical protein n=1 Tax=Plantibacter sp. YIM 135249 TaxID=3423918 RepID=UPI003D32DC96